MAVTRYLIMRHGASESNIAGLVQGIKDVPLAALGKAQAEAAGKAIAGIGVTKIIASPLQRALETGLIVAQQLGLQVSINPGLQARDLGEWADKPRAEIKEMWADLEHPFRKDPDFAPPKGESLRQVDERLFRAVDTILELDEAEVPLLVMHLIGTGALVNRETQAERPSFHNAEIWEIDRTTRSARAVFKPDDDTFFPGHE